MSVVMNKHLGASRRVCPIEVVLEETTQSAIRSGERRDLW